MDPGCRPAPSSPRPRCSGTLACPAFGTGPTARPASTTLPTRRCRRTGASYSATASRHGAAAPSMRACQRGWCHPGRPRPIAGASTALPAVRRGRPHRPCHLRAIPNTTPPVRHGPPRTLLTTWPRRPLLQIWGNTNGKDGVTRVDRWGHGGATSGPRATGSQRTTPVNTGPPSAEVAGHTPHPPQVAAIPGRSLTRKRSQVQTLSRPPLFSLVSALSAPGGQRPWVPRPRCGRGLLPAGPEWASGAGQHGTNTSSMTTQRGHHHLPAQAAWPGITPATSQDPPAGRLVSTCSFSCYPANRPAPDAGPAPLRAASAAPHPARMRYSGPGLPSTFVRATHGHARPSLPGPIRAVTTKPLADHSDTSNPMRPEVGCPPHRRIPGCSALWTARMHRPRIPQACPSGHPHRSCGHRSRGHRTSARPVDGRPPGGQRTRTGRRTAWPASGHPPRPRRPPAGRPKPR
jgi:hypothetical protein